MSSIINSSENINKDLLQYIKSFFSKINLSKTLSKPKDKQSLQFYKAWEKSDEPIQKTTRNITLYK